MSFRLLKDYAGYDWIERVEADLAGLCSDVALQQTMGLVVTPQLSVFVYTDGWRYPPLFLSGHIVHVLSEVQAEVDCDIVAIEWESDDLPVSAIPVVSDRKD